MAPAKKQLVLPVIDLGIRACDKRELLKMVVCGYDAYCKALGIAEKILRIQLDNKVVTPDCLRKAAILKMEWLWAVNFDNHFQ